MKKNAIHLILEHSDVYLIDEAMAEWAEEPKTFDRDGDYCRKNYSLKKTVNDMFQSIDRLSAGLQSRKDYSTCWGCQDNVSDPRAWS